MKKEDNVYIIVAYGPYRGKISMDKNRLWNKI